MYLNVYDKKGKAIFRAVNIIQPLNGRPAENMTTLIRTAYYEHGVAKADYDLCQTAEAAESAAQARSAPRKAA